jgi:hypothetical protein
LLGLAPFRQRHSIPLRFLATVSGPVDFARLYLSKGVEQQLLVERRVVETGRAEYRYEVAP